MTKKQFLTAYRADLYVRYDWAKDTAKLDRFMSSVERTITTVANTWNHDSDSARAVWRRAGLPGKPTLKALRALPESGSL
jgi:hypothetical protein